MPTPPVRSELETRGPAIASMLGVPYSDVAAEAARLTRDGWSVQDALDRIVLDWPS